MNNGVTCVIFGGTGDLAKRKLFPGLYCLYHEERLDDHFSIVGIGRRSKTREEFLEDVRKGIASYSRCKLDESIWERFASRVHYYQLDVQDEQGYRGLKERLEELESQYNPQGNRLFYLAMAPDRFGTAAQNINNAGLKETPGWKRLIIEKPFGHDLESAKVLNQEIEAAFSEEETYRIDHYLGKEMVQNIEYIRFANPMFEPLWNNRYIDNVQITLSETVGVEDRAGYYDTAGALRDMVQNHMLQMVMLVAMEPPKQFETEAIRDEKVKVLRALRRYSPEDVKNWVVRGQYSAGENGSRTLPGYTEEPGVNPGSTTETYVAAALFIDNPRWSGVPFYIRTGKRMPVRTTEIVIEFKGTENSVHLNPQENLDPNLLVIRIQPDEGIYLVLNAKRPGIGGDINPIAMEFSNNYEQEHSIEAYERLFHDCINGISTYFTRWDEVLEAWAFADPIELAWKLDASALAYYRAGSWGPVEADRLLEKAGHKWWPVGESSEEVVQLLAKTGKSQLDGSKPHPVAGWS